MLNLTQIQARIPAKIGNTKVSALSGDFKDKCHEAAGNFLAQVRPYSVIRRSRIANAIYDHVYNYACEDDVESNAVIDIRPVGPRSTEDKLSGRFSQEFDVKKAEDTFEIEYVNGVKTLRLSKNLTARTVIHTMDSLIDGTVTFGGDASGEVIDQLDYVSGMGSFSFDLSGATGQATVTFNLPSAIDISTMEDIGALFEWLEFPDVSRLTSVQLKVGSSSAAYWHETATAAHDRTFAGAGDNAWMLLVHELVDATKVGAPSAGSIQWVQIVINYTAGAVLTNVRIDNMTAALGAAWEIVYYSNRLFTDSTGVTWKQIPTQSSDILRLDGSSEVNAFIYELLQTILPESKGEKGETLRKMYEKKLGVAKTANGDGTGLYGEIARKFPDQSACRQVEYYQW